MLSAIATEVKTQGGINHLRASNDNLPPNYNQMMWYDKLDLFDPIDLLMWQFSAPMRLVPTEAEARTIKLRGRV